MHQKQKQTNFKNLQALENVILQLSFLLPCIGRICGHHGEERTEKMSSSLRKRIVTITLDLHVLVIGF